MKRMKKTMLTLLIVSLFILPAGAAALSGQGEVSDQGMQYVPGSVPAGTGMAETMTPALHGMVLAMLNRNVSAFDPDDSELAWESLYNMLSLYGQLDSRAQEEDEVLTVPVETAADYSAALNLSLQKLGSCPASLADRLRCNKGEGVYTLACGSDDLAQLRLLDVQPLRGGVQVSGALVYLVDGTELARFQAEIQPQDTMFGCAVTALTLA